MNLINWIVSLVTLGGASPSGCGARDEEKKGDVNLENRLFV